MKRDHESLPEVVFNSNLLMQKVHLVLREQEAMRKVLEGYAKSGDISNYPIHGPDFTESWTPENGRFYESRDSKFKYMMKDGWLHVDVTLGDGAVFYFEVNEEGSVRNTNTPYPINEYRVDIPQSAVLRQERIELENGNYDIKTYLKWSKGNVVEHYRYDGVFMGANCNTRCSIDHQQRLISVL
ncbi:MAG: hypothetical protein HRU38_16460 [Saccharospirillaceae bacterium]|nr:hypothetical protein [Saccharospirillaceae bacterium]